MSDTQSYKNLTLADRSVIRVTLMHRQVELEKLIQLSAEFKEVAYDRLRTQLRTELEQVQTVLGKVRP